MLIVVDTSAIVAVITKENDADRYERALIEANGVLMSVANLLELHLVVTDYRRFVDVHAVLDVFRVVPEPVTVAHLTLAKAA